MGRIYSALLAALLVVAAQAEGKWQTNFDAAKQQAQKENKALLLDFTGSDWCPPCMRLKTVFDKPEFEKFAVKNLILVEVDFPRKKKLPADLEKQNRTLESKFKVSAYPTIILTDADGKELGRLPEGYGGESPENYIKKIEQILAKRSAAK